MCYMLLTGLVEAIVNTPPRNIVDGKVISPEVLIRTSDGVIHHVDYVFTNGDNKLVIVTTD